ncbi:MAG: hypothetical protein PVI30_14775 [Myxococcales bacterium]|jgi:hypothetical protein
MNDGPHAPAVAGRIVALVCWGLLAGCGEVGGSGEAVAGAGTSAGPAGSMVAGNQSGNGELPGSTREICRRQCETASTCVPGPANVPQAECEEQCVTGVGLFDGSCQTLALDEAECAAELSCGDTLAYVDGRRGSEICGHAYDPFADACLFNAGRPMPGGVALCEAANTCAVPGVLPPQGCAENMLFVLTGLWLGRGVGRAGERCANAMDDGFACVASLDCSEVEQTFTAGLTPAACASADRAVADACQR